MLAIPKYKMWAHFLMVAIIWLAMIGMAWAATPQAVQKRLAQARENLRISQATERRISAELDQLKKSDGVSPDVIADYEIYLDRVQAMVAENEKIVSEMEAAYARYVGHKKEPITQSPEDMDKMLNPTIPEQESIDEVAALDRELNASLSDFDDMLLKEMDNIQAKSAKKLQDLAAEAAEAAKRLREKGIEADSSSAETSSEAEAEADETKAEQEKAEGAEKETADTKAGEDEKEVAAKEASREGSEGTAQERGGRGSSEDDDIVARQLREAAENETDPELKEKLWKEYEEYKKNTRK
jgi:hypothetical protein